VVEGDIQACFDNVDHQILMELVQERIIDRKVLRLVRLSRRATYGIGSDAPGA
jgi:RNA-directed DNA polymerase